MKPDRRILHVDMDAFYASVEQRDDPALSGRPVAVGGATRGVVAAASYEARRFGIRSAMPMQEALRRCPELVRVRPRMDHYRAVSREVFKVFREFTPEVEGLSLDEAFLDVSGSEALFGRAEDIAKAIKARIRERTLLSASVGVASNKLVAKIASDLDKPDGLVVVPPERVQAVLDPLPVGVIPGIGPRTLEKLRRQRIETVGALRTAADSVLRQLFGRHAERMRERAAGHDERPVVSAGTARSLSAEETFDDDIRDRPLLEGKLLRLTERVAARLRDKALFAGTVQLKVRRADFRTYSRQCGLHPSANDTDSLYRAARGLLAAWLADHPGQAVRLLGVGGTELAPARQADLFDAADPAPRGALDEAADRIRERFGDLPVGRARSFDKGRIR